MVRGAAFALSEDPVKVESLPHIDIFDEYRLYSISGIEQGKFLHSLRLGFFSSENSAQAVARIPARFAR